ncbi:hypothetical protein KSS87_001774 [Heliosperma pusillum]|nr:hypothetical protein KSS87_001774 [Heliosperma pusillum]
MQLVNFNDCNTKFVVETEKGARKLNLVSERRKKAFATTTNGPDRCGTGRCGDVPTTAGRVGRVMAQDQPDCAKIKTSRIPSKRRRIWRRSRKPDYAVFAILQNLLSNALKPFNRECFYAVFEEEIHNVIVENQLFRPGERVAIGASGGKDSTVLAYVLSKLNQRHNYDLDLFLLSVDEGITGYRDDSLETVKRNEIQYGLPLKVVSYKDLYGWTMDEIVKMIGLKNNCTFCGVFRRQALDRGAAMLKVDKLVTGHNADDIAETVLLNILRGDIARLSRCTAITTGEDGPIPRCKPFKYTYEKEIVIYP